jgi:hypothetical protein
MSKFKVGDKIVLIKKHGFLTGTKGTYLGMRDEYYARIRFDAPLYPYMSETDFHSIPLDYLKLCNSSLVKEKLGIK